MTVLYPGSFDPPTLGHLAVIQRSARLFDRVVVLVIANPGKRPVATIKERLSMLEPLTEGLQNVSVEMGEGMLLHELQKHGANAILRGLRGEADYQAERPVTDGFLSLYGVETIFLQCEPSRGFISSSMTREILRLGGAASGLVPPEIAETVARLYGKR